MPDNRDEERRRAEQVGRSPLSTLMGASRSGLTFTTAALDEYRALIIDVTRLAVASPSAWSVFTTARSHIAQRSDIPMTLVCGTIKGQKALRRNGISRDIPVYWRVAAAIAALPDDDEHAYRRRAHAELSPQSRWLERWPTIPLRTGSGGPVSCVSPGSGTQ
jgi:hypothetical protein